MTSDDWRGRDEQALATWRGEIATRVGTLEREMSQLAKNTSSIDRTVTRMDGKVVQLRYELEECRKEMREAAQQIDQGKTDAVEELKATISAKDTRWDAWKLSLVAGVFMVIAAVVPTLITLALNQ